MVDLFSRHDNSSLKTQLTEGMLRSILVTDPLPCTTVSFLRCFIPAVLLIITVDLLLMLRTVTTICKVRTARITARSFWLLRNDNHLLQGKRKALRDFSRKAPSILSGFLFRLSPQCFRSQNVFACVQARIESALLAFSHYHNNMSAMMNHLRKWTRLPTSDLSPGIPRYHHIMSTTGNHLKKWTANHGFPKSRTVSLSNARFLRL